MSIYIPTSSHNEPVELTLCREGVHSRDSWLYSQCSRRGKHLYVSKKGEVLLYCKQHHPDTVKTRREAVSTKRKLRQEGRNARTVRLGLAMATVEELRAALAQKEKP